ncbi:hypothetical protein CTA2_6942 [Colletotrichum tanaceti]|uniref:Uncharacterized protein n=1 Tax=Colletotrichum tanaceti TaxID=1306861 RepID=A0A4V6DGY9_9PEZI|nr:hypothetical protein CTA2_6942 [Colletotrichum tanaceti]TKW54596.1 hypothetical protein CTA1_3436 [Colletotrichum tanaceti]
MQLTTLAAGLLALAAASASADPAMGTIKMFFDPDSDCTGTPTPSNGGGGGLSVWIPPDYVGRCHRIPVAVGNKPYKRFSASVLAPIFSFELYTDSGCQNLATNASDVCVSDVVSYIGRRRDGN